MKHLRLIFALVLTLLTMASASWPMPQRTKDQGTEVRQKVAAQATTPNGSVPAQVEFAYSPGRGGGFPLTLYLPDASVIKGFDFDEFEGPDAPSGSRKLGQVRVQSSGGAAVFNTSVSGWYDSDKEFVFQVELKQLPPATGKQFLTALSASDAKLTFSVHGMKKPGQIIISTVADAPFLNALKTQIAHR